MTNEVLVALITGGLAFLGVIVTNIGNNRKMQKELEKIKQLQIPKSRNLQERFDNIITLHSVCLCLKIRLALPTIE